MIGQVMKACNNYFLMTHENILNEITSTHIKGPFYDTYLQGQYILINGTRLNDGVYQIVSVSSNGLELEGLLPEATVEYFELYGLAPSKEFRSLVSTIEAWVQVNGNKQGITSESIDDYSVSFDSSKGSPGDWKTAFNAQLNSYRKAFNTIPKLGNIRTKW